MKFDLLYTIFTTRAYRLSAFFMISVLFNLLKADLGRKIIYTAGVATLGFIIFAVFKNIPEARMMYLSLAVFHGYFEMTTLAFTQVKPL